MPSIARTIGLIFVVVHPACLAAQTARPTQPLSGWPGTPAIGYSHRPTERPYGAGVPPASPEVVPAGYTAPLASAGLPSASGKTAQPAGETSPGVPLSPRGRQSPLPLPPPGRSGHSPQGGSGGLASVVTVASSLAIVLGVFFLVAWGLRRAGYPLGAAASTVLPGEVFEVLGRAPMASRQQVHLLRCGNKLVLVSVTPAGAETLTEVTDPVEVDRLAGLCRQAHPHSATAAFRQVLGQFTAARPSGGFLGENNHEDLRLAATQRIPGLPAAPGGLENRHG